jgi:hypothetical protein
MENAFFHVSCAEAVGKVHKNEWVQRLIEINRQRIDNDLFFFKEIASVYNVDFSTPINSDNA